MMNNKPVKRRSDTRSIWIRSDTMQRLDLFHALVKQESGSKGSLASDILDEYLRERLTNAIKTAA